MKKSPNEVDRYVGSRVRMRRVLIGMSQERLGDALGLTFQQVQKYEKGSNRISASRLQQIAKVLGVAIDYFYEGLPDAPGGASEAGFAEASQSGYDAGLVTQDGLKLLKAVNAISNPEVRKRLADLVTAIAKMEQPQGHTRSE